MKNIFLLVLTSFFIIFLPCVTFGHMTGQSLEAISGNYLVDVGYSSSDLNPKAGEGVLFDFKLLAQQTKLAIDYSEVFVKVEQNGAGIFYAKVPKSAFGPTVVLLAFPKEEKYDLVLKFTKDGNTLAQSNFNLHVEKGNYEATNTKTKNYNTPLILGVGIFMGVCLDSLFYFFRTRKNNKVI